MASIFSLLFFVLCYPHQLTPAIGAPEPLPRPALPALGTTLVEVLRVCPVV